MRTNAMESLAQSFCVAVMNVLLVDDDDALRSALVAAVRSVLGFRVDAFADGPAALELARTRHWDVAVLDIDMGPMHGIDLALALRRADATLPVVFLTGTAIARWHAELEAVATYEWVRKPVPTKAVVAAIRRAIAQRDP